ncbi:hypothetical protein PQQ65_18480 [Paraburkholderia strydomiana]|uniref:hypothetical protein n=1 Tax=Paraburkholderia strydomiana TaxID=1245417 RepID=UPI0038BA352A
MTDHQDASSSSSNNDPATPPSPNTPSQEGLSGPGPAQPRAVPTPAPGTPRTPGGNRLNAIDEADADKVVPKNPEETQLRDATSPPGAGSRSVDDEGSPPKPL